MRQTLRILIASLMLWAAHAAACAQDMPTDSIAATLPASEQAFADEPVYAHPDSLETAFSISLPLAEPYDKFARFDDWEEREELFMPDPTRAVWMSALFPGMGQVYNRRYWKLPIIAGGYLGLAYATSWNNTMLSDYTRAYRDITDTDPATNSYMNLFPPTVSESSIDKTWLTSVLKNKRDYFRRNRDLCIISMVGVYLLAMVDAYVDASLSHYDITPDLSIDVSPALLQDGRGVLPSVGMTWSITF